MEIKETQIKRSKSKNLFADDRIVYISDPKNSTKEQLINIFNKVARYKIN